MANELEGALRAAAEPLIDLVEREDTRTDELCGAVGALEYDDVLEGEVSSVETDDGDVLEGSLEGEISFALEEAISSRREAKDNGNALLDLLARLSRLELTTVTVKLGRHGATPEQAAAAIIGRASDYGVFLLPLQARSVDDDGEADDTNDEDEDEAEEPFFADSGADDEDTDDEDDEDEELDDEGFPAGGWGHAAAAASARRPKLSADEQLYLQVAELTWPCAVADVRARRLRALAKRHPDPIRHWNPTLADRYEEEYKRLQLGHDALIARCVAAGRA
jgi:hypothetical protein